MLGVTARLIVALASSHDEERADTVASWEGPQRRVSVRPDAPAPVRCQRSQGPRWRELAVVEDIVRGSCRQAQRAASLLDNDERDGGTAREGSSSTSVSTSAQSSTPTPVGRRCRAGDARRTHSDRKSAALAHRRRQTCCRPRPSTSIQTVHFKKDPAVRTEDGVTGTWSWHLEAIRAKWVLKWESSR